MKKHIEFRDVAHLLVFILVSTSVTAIASGEFALLPAVGAAAVLVLAVWAISRTAVGQAVSRLFHIAGEAVYAITGGFIAITKFSAVAIVTLLVLAVTLTVFYTLPGLALLLAVFIAGGWIVKRVNRVTDAAAAHAAWARRN